MRSTLKEPHFFRSYKLKNILHIFVLSHCVLIWSLSSLAGEAQVIVTKTYFIQKNEDGDFIKRKEYLIRGDKVRYGVGTGSYVFAKYRNTQGRETSGWLKQSDLKITSAGDYNPVFEFVLDQIKSKFKGPILLPNHFYGQVSYSPILEEVTEDSFTLSFVYGIMETMVSTAGSLGHLSVSKLKEGTKSCFAGLNTGVRKKSKGQKATQDEAGDVFVPVKLKNGATAYWREGSCGASCSGNELVWQHGKYCYSMGGKGQQKEDLAQVNEITVVRP